MATTWPCGRHFVGPIIGKVIGDVSRGTLWASETPTQVKVERVTGADVIGDAIRVKSYADERPRDV